MSKLMKVVGLAENDGDIVLTVKATKKQGAGFNPEKAGKGKIDVSAPVAEIDQVLALGAAVEFDAAKIEVADEDEAYVAWFAEYVPVGNGGNYTAEEEVEEEVEEEDEDEEEAVEEEDEEEDEEEAVEDEDPDEDPDDEDDEDPDEDDANAFDAAEFVDGKVKLVIANLADIDDEDELDEIEEAENERAKPRKRVLAAIDDRRVVLDDEDPAAEDEDEDEDEDEEEDEDEDEDEDEEEAEVDEFETVLGTPISAIKAHLKEIDDPAYLLTLLGREGEAKNRAGVIKAINARRAKIDPRGVRAGELAVLSGSAVAKIAKALKVKRTGKKSAVIERILSAEFDPPEEKAPKKVAKKGKEPEAAKKVKSKKTPREKKIDPITAQIATMIDSVTAPLQAMYDLCGARRAKLAISALFQSFDPTHALATKVGGGKFALYHVPGMIWTAVKNHRDRPNGEKWGSCEYQVRCEDDGGYTLIGFKGNRPDVQEVVGTTYPNANSLLQVLTLRDYPRVQIYKYFDVDLEQARKATKALLAGKALPKPEKTAKAPKPEKKAKAVKKGKEPKAKKTEKKKGKKAKKKAKS